MPARRALPSMSAMRGFFAPASSSTSRTCSASCSIAEATALMPATHWDCLLIRLLCPSRAHARPRPARLVLLLHPLGRRAARRNRRETLIGALFDQAEVDAPILD